MAVTSATDEHVLEGRRTLSAEGSEALAALKSLRTYFRSDVQLAEALGWSEDTVRAWRRGGPTRTRLDHRDAVLALLAICQEAARWISSPLEVGAWALEPTEVLKGATPAQGARLGRSAAEKLLEIFPRIAPKTRVRGRVEFSAEQLEEILESALEDSDAPEIRPSRRVEVDLSDFDD